MHTERRASNANGLPLQQPGQRLAVIGSGISGLAAAWLLSQRHHVTLFEADERPGGHTHTVDVEIGDTRHGVDTGFLVFNRSTYPALCAMFSHLGVPVAASDMSFSVSVQDAGIEWAGSDLRSVFAQPRNVLRPAFLGMLRDILRFNAAATRLAQHPEHEPANLTLGRFLAREGYGRGFRDWYLLPMAAAIWSCPTGTMLDYPISTFVRFCSNHGLLQITDRPQWYTVPGGARRYVARLLEQLGDVRLATPVRAVRRQAGCVRLRLDDGWASFDQVILATHSDQSLDLLGPAASGTERRCLAAIGYQRNEAVLHTDVRLLPRRRAAWAAWNYRTDGAGPDRRAVSVSYLLNRLQPLPFDAPVIVSLNPFEPPAPERVIKTMRYQHPVFDAAAVAAQGLLPHIQGHSRVWYAGAWTGYGFHEDGLRSALNIARHFGIDAPWQQSPGQVEAWRGAA